MAMEEETKKKKQGSCIPISLSSPPSSAVLGMHRDSQVISKPKPKIRIIHIFAPEIIKTDVANFRELVQRLTGKPSDKNAVSGNRNNKSSAKPRSTLPRPSSSSKDHHHHHHHHHNRQELIVREKINVKDEEEEEEEEEMWGSAGEGFLGGFGELDGFMHEFGEYSLLPLDASHCSFDLFAETHRSSSSSSAI
ncbi:VQ motif-containing protein 17 [Malania oleifera]|uniref:VQ motif-containing protein 17 n=1 Tax=Malania oleifera TaxID=397392 RepID=UPI0025AEA58B|nr:VQ motif-containing protein 17 [Malania oleifera]